LHSDISRRARTLCARTAAEEAARLASTYLRTGGVTNAAADPSEAGHGVKTLPQVAEEALALLSVDHVIKRRLPALDAPLRAMLEKLTKEEPQHTHSDVAQFNALLAHLEQSYVDSALDCIEALLTTDTKALLELEAVCEAFVSDVRARGWT